MERIRIAAIGCGNNMRGHLRRLLEMPEVEIVALVDPSEASLQRTVEAFPSLKGLPVFADHRRMLEAIRPEAVVISTPHAFHHRQIMDSLEAGAHVQVEKPMVCSVQEALEVVAKWRETGKVVLVSYQRHTQPIYRKMKAMVEAGMLGTITYVTCLQHQRWYRNQLAARQEGRGWRWNLALSGGGQLNDSGSHMVDLILWLTDLEPQVVHCFQQNFELAVDVNSAINVRFANGAIGTINIVGDAPGIGGSVWEDLTLFGTEGALYYRQLARPEYKPFLEFRRFDQEAPQDMGPLPEGSNPDRNFVNAILGREPCLSPPTYGLRVIQLSEAAWESARTGRPVEVRSDETPPSSPERALRHHRQHLDAPHP